MDVEKDEIGLLLVDGGDGRESIAHLADALDPRHARQQVTDLLPGERLVVHDEGGNRIRHDAPAASRRSAGNTTVTEKPSPGAVRMSRRARVP